MLAPRAGTTYCRHRKPNSTCPRGIASTRQRSDAPRQHRTCSWRLRGGTCHAADIVTHCIHPVILVVTAGAHATAPGGQGTASGRRPALAVPWQTAAMRRPRYCKACGSSPCPPTVKPEAGLAGAVSLRGEPTTLASVPLAAVWRATSGWTPHNVVSGPGKRQSTMYRRVGGWLE